VIDRALPVALLLLVATLPSAAAGADSRYTPLLAPDCRPVAAGDRERYVARGLEADECPAPAGYRLFVVSDGARSWIDLDAGGRLWPGEDAVIRGAPVGLMPNVAGAKVAEWRLDGAGTPRALIFRVTAQNPEAPDRNLSQLYIVGLGPGEPCLLGRVAGNEAARTLADTALGCPAPP
jgi:hypothetical protein